PKALGVVCSSGGPSADAAKVIGRRMNRTSELSPAAAPAVPPRLSLMGRLGSGLSSEKTKAYPAWIQPTISSRIRMASRRAAPA
ncbi:MAG: hypothetical protein ACLUFA_12120, partial [[Clostridium] leptum]